MKFFNIFKKNEKKPIKNSLLTQLETFMEQKDVKYLFMALVKHRQNYYATKIVYNRHENIDELRGRILELESFLNFITTKHDDLAETELVDNPISFIENLARHQDKNIAKKEKKRYNINDYLESKDFNGSLDL